MPTCDRVTRGPEQLLCASAHRKPSPDVHGECGDAQHVGSEAFQRLIQSVGMEAEIEDLRLVTVCSGRRGEVLERERFGDRAQVPTPLWVGACLRPNKEHSHG